MWNQYLRRVVACGCKFNLEGEWLKVDGRHFNFVMIQKSYVNEYTYRVPSKHQDKLKRAGKEARENQKGLQGDARPLT